MGKLPESMIASALRAYIDCDCDTPEEAMEAAVLSALSDLEANGWKLVPINPPMEMISAGAKAAKEGEDKADGSDNWRALTSYKAMLAAAPDPTIVCNEPTDGYTQPPLPVTDPITKPVDAVKEQLAEALRQSVSEFNIIDCENITETRNIRDVLDRCQFFARRGVKAASVVLRAYEKEKNHE